MTTANEIRYATRVRELSKMRMGDLRKEERRLMSDRGLRRVYGEYSKGQTGKDEIIGSILRLEGLE